MIYLYVSTFTYFYLYGYWYLYIAAYVETDTCMLLDMWAPVLYIAAYQCGYV